MTQEIDLQTEQDSLRLGALIADAIQASGQRLVVLYLSGDLGAGKTTLSRGILRSLGHEGQVKSPTYTLVEPYELADVLVYHFDLYRLGDPEELEFMGVRDYFDVPPESEKKAVCLVEWPEKAAGFVPEPDISLHLSVSGMGRLAKMECGNQRLSQQLRERLTNEFTK